MLEFSKVHDKYKAFRDLNKILLSLLEKNNKIELLIDDKKDEEAILILASKMYNVGRPVEKDDFKSYEYTEYLRDVERYNRTSNDYKLYIQTSSELYSIKDKLRKELEDFNTIVKTENYRKLLLKTYGYKKRKTGTKFLRVLQKKTKMLADLYKDQCKIVKAYIKQNDLIRINNATGIMLSKVSGVNLENEYSEFHELKSQQLKIIKKSKKLLIDRYTLNKDTIALIMSGHLDATLRD